ncbi:uncharacterized protein NPIL_660411 [Nephila pilipes]|uniref:Uncharacterized protein n=1 Tax=Nephila pilipes TaxID=299642 RepID=A0A8X6TYG6_NEPPI|nr:uncharacterized protein NPIL_660411 [Nephila pilipes]
MNTKDGFLVDGSCYPNDIIFIRDFYVYLVNRNRLPFLHDRELFCKTKFILRGDHEASVSSCVCLSGFFGFFRRRSPKPAVVEEISPEGPVNFSPFNFPQRSGLLTPFSGINRGGFLPTFSGFPGFPGGLFLSHFVPGLPRTQWPTSQSIPQPGPPKSPSIQGKFPPQNIPSAHFASQGFDQNLNFQPDSDREARFEDQPQTNTEDAENFFTLLAETDEHKCISRLVCEMGADPSSTGELGTTIAEIIGSLRDFPDGSKVFQYNQVLQEGVNQGLDFCRSRYSSCDEESYELMKASQAEDAATSA